MLPLSPVQYNEILKNKFCLKNKAMQKLERNVLQVVGSN